MNDEQLSTLLERCRTGKRSEQIDAVFELVESKSYAAIPVLIELLNSNDSNIRSTAAEALGDIGEYDRDRTGVVLLSLLNDSDYLVRSDIVESLGKLRYSPSRTQIEYLLASDPEWLVRASAAETLSKLREKDSLGSLEVALKNDPVEAVRGWAAFAIGLIGDVELLEHLADYLVIEQDVGVKADILCAKYRLGSQSDLIPLLKLLKTKNKGVVYGVVNRIENLVKNQPPSVLADDVSMIIQALLDVVNRYPATEFQVHEVVQLLSKIASGDR